MRMLGSVSSSSMILESCTQSTQYRTKSSEASAQGWLRRQRRCGSRRQPSTSSTELLATHHQQHLGWADATNIEEDDEWAQRDDANKIKCPRGAAFPKVEGFRKPKVEGLETRNKPTTDERTHRDVATQPTYLQEHPHSDEALRTDCIKQNTILKWLMKRAHPSPGLLGSGPEYSMCPSIARVFESELPAGG